MRVLITGGSGLIGSALSAALAADGHEVLVLSRKPETVTGLAQGVRAVQWDAQSADGWGELADGAGAIVNLAGANIGEGRWSDERKREIVDSRANAGKAVMAAIEGASVKPGVLIQSSAIGYYGPQADQEITESTSPGSDFLALTAFDWETTTAGAERLGVRRPVIRTGVVLTTEGGALPRMLLPFKMFAGGPLGSGKQWLSWIHIQDTVRAIQFLIEHESATGPFNVTAPNPLTNKEFGQVIGQVMGRPSILPAPAFALKTMLGEMSAMVLEGQRVLPKRLEELGFTFLYPDAESALKELLAK